MASVKTPAYAQIRLIGAVAVHGFVPGHAGQRQLDVYVQHLLEQSLQEAFLNLQDVFLVHEGHLQVDLGEFRLAVRS